MMKRGATNRLPRAFLCLPQNGKSRTAEELARKKNGIGNLTKKYLRDHCHFGLTSE